MTCQLIKQGVEKLVQTEVHESISVKERMDTGSLYSLDLTDSLPTEIRQL